MNEATIATLEMFNGIGIATCRKHLGDMVPHVMYIMDLDDVKVSLLKGDEADLSVCQCRRWNGDGKYVQCEQSSVFVIART